MGRAGSGGGGGSRSGGGHSSGRSGGGHHVSSSRSSSSHSRAGSGSRSSFSSGSSYRSSGRSSGSGFGGSPRGGFGGPPPRYHGGYGAPPPRRRGYARSSGGGCSSVIGGIIALFIIAVIAYAIIRAMGSRFMSDFSQQTITHNRSKLESGIGFYNDCIIDELDWFDNESRTESQLQSFYDATGVQPFIYLKAYDPSLTTDEQKDQWAIDYYDDNFSAENIFLYVYFAEEDTDNDVGYMSYANGEMVNPVMDSEAVDIFWDNIDRYWFTDYSTDEVFIRTFNDTANTIMADVNAKTNLKTAVTKLAIVVLVVIAIIIVLIILLVWWSKKKQREKEEAEETERILNTPMDTLVDQNLKDLENKYK